MTAFLAINGIPIPVADGAASSAVDDVGVSARMSDGSLVRNRRAVKGSWDIETVLDVQATALAMKGLVLGAGHVWDFEASLYSAKGLVIAGGAQSSAQKRYGNQALQIAALGSAVITSSYDYATRPWTAAFWWWNGSSWFHVVETSTGRRMENGVYLGARTFSTPGTGTLTIANGVAATRYLDDLWVAEYVMPDSWAASIYAAGAPAGGAPRLTASGLLIEGGTRSVTCYGEVKGLKTQQAFLGGAWAIGHSLQATLTEV